MKSWLTGNDPDAGKDWRQEKGMTEDEMVGWHHQLNGHGFGWTLGLSDGQGGLGCCGSWGPEESDTAEWLVWLNWCKQWLHCIPHPNSSSLPQLFSHDLRTLTLAEISNPQSHPCPLRLLWSSPLYIYNDIIVPGFHLKTVITVYDSIYHTPFQVVLFSPQNVPLSLAFLF